MGVRQWAQGVLRSVLRFDASALEFGFALRCTVGVAIPLAIACATGHPASGFAPAIGALIGGFTSLQGIYRSRMAVVLAVTLGISISSFLGALLAPSLPALIVLSAILGYAYGTIAQLGLPAGVAALNTAVAFVIFSSLPLTPRQDLEQSSMLFLGGLIQAVLLVLVWPLDRSAIERRGLAAAYRELEAYARSLISAAPQSPPIAGLTTARQIVADQQPLARSRDVARYKRILADGEALRHRLGALMLLRVDEGKERPELVDLAEAIAEQLGALATTLDGSTSREQLETVRTRTVSAFETFEHAYASDPFALALVRDIAAHLRDATQGVAVAATGQPVRLLFSARPRPSAYIQTKIDWFGRDAIRTAAILALAMLVGHTLFSATRGYWIALTAVLVLQPGLQGTIVRGLARIAGTVLGAVIAMLALLATHGNPAVQSVIIVAAAAGCYLTQIPNYALFSTAMTVFVVLALDLLGTGRSTVGDRVLDTLIGGAMAMLGYVIFPSWARRRTRPLLADTIDAQRAFAVALLDAYVEPQRVDRADIDVLRTRCWKIRTETEASIDAARAEPHRPHTIGVGRALNVIAAVQTFSLASMALEAGLETMPPAPPFAALAPFRDALDATMHEIAGALLENRPVALDGSLEAEYRRVADAVDASTHATDRFALDYASGYVQSAATLAQLAGGNGAA
jgi:uncharacterized membrane protein YccC